MVWPLQRPQRVTTTATHCGGSGTRRNAQIGRPPGVPIGEGVAGCPICADRGEEPQQGEAWRSVARAAARPRSSHLSRPPAPASWRPGVVTGRQDEPGGRGARRLPDTR